MSKTRAMESAAATFELGAQFQMIIDFAVERDYGAARSIDDGLIAAVKVNNF